LPGKRLKDLLQNEIPFPIPRGVLKLIIMETPLTQLATVKLVVTNILVLYNAAIFVAFVNLVVFFSFFVRCFYKQTTQSKFLS
jgi:hypothetical protein